MPQRSEGIAGCITKYVTVYSPDVKVVWTLDGTKPSLSQEDKAIMGSDYPFGKVMTGKDYSNLKPYTGSLQVRGTAACESPSTIWAETERVRFPHCNWIMAYNGSDLVQEEFYYSIY